MIRVASAFSSKKAIASDMSFATRWRPNSPRGKRLLLLPRHGARKVVLPIPLSRDRQSPGACEKKTTAARSCSGPGQKRRDRQCCSRGQASFVTGSQNRTILLSAPFQPSIARNRHGAFIRTVAVVRSARAPGHAFWSRLTSERLRSPALFARE